MSKIMKEAKEAAKTYCDNVRNATGRDSDPVNAFQAGAQWQAEQSPWISVKERLPKNRCIVMVRGEYGGTYTACLHGENSGFITYGEDDYKAFGEVTHWMPIPE